MKSAVEGMLAFWLKVGGDEAGSIVRGWDNLWTHASG